MQNPSHREAFVPCAERIRVAVAELTAIFPQVRTSLIQILKISQTDFQSIFQKFSTVSNTTMYDIFDPTKVTIYKASFLSSDIKISQEIRIVRKKCPQ